jgi:hypothetical protein
VESCSGVGAAAMNRLRDKRDFRSGTSYVGEVVLFELQYLSAELEVEFCPKEPRLSACAQVTRESWLLQ